METNNDTEKTSDSSHVVLPNGGLPPEVAQLFQKGMKPSVSRSVVFETDKQRNLGALKKGLQKPGFISYEVLRRAAMSVAVARICITSLKEKVTKTEWVIKSKDPMVDVEQSRIDKLTELFNNPNPQDTWREFIDKVMEDLLVLDTSCIEKTRFPEGELAQLYYVDAATIRPVFDEFGNQDIPIKLKTLNGEETLPVSYLQIFNNSMYGGPESGDIVAAWPKKDFICFHMHPQGAMERFGYGLSPIESVLQVVNNLLNSDNYNGSYFDEGSFPPIIMQLAGNIQQRDLEAYREYMYSELAGNFHRPAIMAGGGELKIHNLKDSSNRDMQFMEYTNWLAKLMCAAFGLSPQDIGLTDSVGGKNVAEEQADLSNQKGYSSCLHLIEEIINNQIILKDFGFKDLQFKFVLDDSTDPEVQTKIHDTKLKNGTITINEVREEEGKIPFESWADQPLLLTAEGYKPLVVEDQEDQEDTENVGEETVYAEDDEGIVKKSVKTLYMSRKVENAEEIIKWAKEAGFSKTVTAEDMHVTVAFSKAPVEWKLIKANPKGLSVLGGIRSIQKLNNAIVLRFESGNLTQRWIELGKLGASWDYAEYCPHITLTYDSGDVDFMNLPPFQGAIKFGKEKISEVNLDWTDSITEKSIYTASGFKTWVDDRGFGQPFIAVSILDGQGWVIKPPVAVNLFSQQLEMDITNMLSKEGLNVKPVRKILYNDVCSMFSSTDLAIEFDKYVNMAPEYDSEKWRAKNGGSRKYPYYMTCDYIDGFPLNSRQIMDDMKRDPFSYRQAVIDLANLWNAERNHVLGDRRADQYLITKDKRAYGFDYQFMGDKKRWEDSSTAIGKVLLAVPSLYKLFMEKTVGEKTKKSQGIIKRLKDIVAKGSFFKPDADAEEPALNFEENPVLFGELFSNMEKNVVKDLFRMKNPQALLDSGYQEVSYNFDWNNAVVALKSYVKYQPNSSGGILSVNNANGVKYCIYFKVEQEIL